MKQPTLVPDSGEVVLDHLTAKDNCWLVMVRRAAGEADCKCLGKQDEDAGNFSGSPIRGDRAALALRSDAGPRTVPISEPLAGKHDVSMASSSFQPPNG